MVQFVERRCGSGHSRIERVSDVRINRGFELVQRGRVKPQYGARHCVVTDSVEETTWRERVGERISVRGI